MRLRKLDIGGPIKPKRQYKDSDFLRVIKTDDSHRAGIHLQMIKSEPPIIPTRINWSKPEITEYPSLPTTMGMTGNYIAQDSFIPTVEPNKAQGNYELNSDYIKRLRKTPVKLKYGGFLTNEIGDSGVSPQAITATAGQVVDALDSGNQYGNQTTGTTIAKSALSGAAAGMTFGPIGAGVGAVIGGGIGLLNANKNKADELKIRKIQYNQGKQLALSATRNIVNNDPYAFSGQQVNMYAFGGQTGLFGKNTPSKKAMAKASFFDKKHIEGFRKLAYGGDPIKDAATKGRNFAVDWIKNRPLAKKGLINYDDIPQIETEKLSNDIFGHYIPSENKIAINKNIDKEDLGVNKDLFTKEMVGTGVHETTHAIQHLLKPRVSRGESFHRWSKPKEVWEKLKEFPAFAINAIGTLNPDQAFENMHDRLEKTKRNERLIWKEDHPDQVGNDPITDSYNYIDSKPRKKTDSFMSKYGLGNANEIHARLMEWREATGTKPTETITPELYYQRKKSLFNSGKQTEGVKQLYNTLEDKHIIDVLNNTVMSTKKDSGLRIAAYGGYLKPLASDSALAVGKSHEKGGIRFPEHNVELENKETVHNGFVFSHRLGFAEPTLRIMKAKGKIEKHLDTNPNDLIAQNSLLLLGDHLETMKDEQESLKNALGITPITKFAFGGSIRKMTYGSYGDDDPITLDTATVKAKRNPFVNKSLLGSNPLLATIDPSRVKKTPLGKIVKTGYSDQKDEVEDNKLSPLALVPLASNVLNALHRLPAPIAPTLATSETIPRISLNAQRANVSNEVARSRKQLNGLSTNLRSAVEGQLLGKKTDAMNQISDTETRANTDIAGRNLFARQQTNLYNTNLLNQYNQDTTEFKLAKIANAQDNFSNAADKLTQVAQDKIEMDNDDKNLRYIASRFSDPVTGKMTDEAQKAGLGDLFKLLGRKRRN